jgi:hypothetical protein
LSFDAPQSQLISQISPALTIAAHPESFSHSRTSKGNEMISSQTKKKPRKRNIKRKAEFLPCTAEIHEPTESPPARKITKKPKIKAIFRACSEATSLSSRIDELDFTSTKALLNKETQCNFSGTDCFQKQSHLSAVKTKSITEFVIRPRDPIFLERLYPLIRDRVLHDMFIEDISKKEYTSTYILDRYLTFFGPPDEASPDVPLTNDMGQLFTVITALLYLPFVDAIQLIQHYSDHHPKIEVTEDEESLIDEINGTYEDEDNDTDEDCLIEETGPEEEVLTARSNQRDEETAESFDDDDEIIDSRKILKRNSSRAPRVYNPIIKHFRLVGGGPITRPSVYELHTQSHIPVRTLFYWKSKVKNNPDWIPVHEHCIKTRRIFTDEQEHEISEYLKREFTRQHRPLTLRHLKLEIISFYDCYVQIWERFIQTGEFDGPITPHKPPPKFRCCNKFLRKFLKRNRFSYRRCRAIRRPVVSEDAIATFQAQLQDALDHTNHDNVINCDETQWLICQPSTKTVVETGVESCQVYLDCDPKSGFTIMAAITASYKKLPLFFIAKGLTVTCERQFKLPPSEDYRVSHSPSGWMSQQPFCDYLHFLNEIRQGENIKLVLDQYTVHISAESRRLASELNIDLITIPRGGTGRFQPLDRRIFGIMKSKGRSKWDRMTSQQQAVKQNKHFAAELALEAWTEITQTNMIAAWDIHEGSSEPPSEPNRDPEFQLEEDEPDSSRDYEASSD